MREFAGHMQFVRELLAERGVKLSFVVVEQGAPSRDRFVMRAERRGLPGRFRGEQADGRDIPRTGRVVQTPGSAGAGGGQPSQFVGVQLLATERRQRIGNRMSRDLVTKGQAVTVDQEQSAIDACGHIGVRRTCRFDLGQRHATRDDRAEFEERPAARIEPFGACQHEVIDRTRPIATIGEDFSDQQGIAVGRVVDCRADQALRGGEFPDRDGGQPCEFDALSHRRRQVVGRPAQPAARILILVTRRHDDE
ncbi:hypothetical protein [Sphingomonas panacisoli]|uniref:hypothetical protein n=1 Tax=Sphingomonas panacisoli TaxID=1813879 RepID=UPI001F01F4A1|nr:hypothetical protein [Sphingomonas panacisoli]